MDAPSGDCWVFVEEVFLAGMPKSSLQGGIHGVFWNKYPIVVTTLKRTDVLTPVRPLPSNSYPRWFVIKWDRQRQ